MSVPEVRAFPTAQEAMAACAEAVADALARAARPQFVLAGGETPRGVYRLLAAGLGLDRVPWAEVGFWFGDERCVGPDHPKSNYRLARTTLFEPLGIPGTHVHRMLGELGPEEGAKRYRERLLGELGPAPRFAVALCGVGPEGHTLSLFPGSPGLDAADMAVATLVPTPPTHRISLTPQAIAGSEAVFFLATGQAKRDALRGAVAAPERDPRHPTSYLRGQSATVIFCDAEASP